MWSTPRRASDFSTLYTMFLLSMTGVSPPSRSHVIRSERPETFVATRIWERSCLLSQLAMYSSVLPCVSAFVGTGYISAVSRKLIPRSSA